MKTIPISMLLLALGTSVCPAGEIAIRDGQKLAFVGDSITQFGASHPVGYVRLVEKGLQVNGISIVTIPAGTSGFTSADMLERLDRVLAKKPDWMTLSCGVNDVQHKAPKRVPLEDFKKNVTQIVERAQAAGVRVLILTATPIREELDNDFNRTLAAYNDFLRGFAKEKACPLADVNAQARAAITGNPRAGRLLTVDGLHMNPRGDELMAEGVLRAFGLDDSQMQTARAAWAAIPEGWQVRFAFYGSTKPKSLYLILPLSREKFEKLDAVAARGPRLNSVMEMLRTVFESDVRDLLAPKGPYASVDAIFDAGKETEILAQLRKKLEQQMDAMLDAGVPPESNPPVPAAAMPTEMKDGEAQRPPVSKALDSGPEAPNVLLIGDSIAGSYVKGVARRLKGRANLYCRASARNVFHPDIRKDLETALKAVDFDIIHFNEAGLHAWRDKKTPAEYLAGARAYLECLRKFAPKARLIWASTTPMTVKGKPEEPDPVYNPIIVGRNRLLAETMRGENIPVDDLYALMAPHLNLGKGDQYHWNDAGNELMAETVAASVAAQLPPIFQTPPARRE